MHGKQKLTGVAGLVLLLACSQGEARGIAEHHAQGFFARAAAGYYFPASKRNLESASLPAIWAGYDFTPSLAMDVGTAVVNTSQNRRAGGKSVHGFLYMLDAIYRLKSVHAFTPWLFVGPQVTSLKPANGSDPVTQTGISGGVGANWFVASSVALSAEARDLYIFTGGKNDVLLTLGVTFLLD